MANLAEITAGLEVELEVAKKRESQAREASQVILDHVQSQGRSHMTVDEDNKLTELKAAREAAMNAITPIQAKLARAKALEAEEIDTEARLSERTRVMPAGNRAGKPAYDEVMRIGQEARTYNAGNDPTGNGFLRDVAVAKTTGDPGAWERLGRHMHEERVERPGMQMRTSSVTTTDAGHIVVPNYLLDMTALAVSKRRPLADSMTHHILPPDGMSVIIPTLSATSAAVQSSELTGVSDTETDETGITLSVKTIAGQQTVSRQAVDRSRMGDFVLQDLLVRVAATLDNEIVTEATHGLDAVAVTGSASADGTWANVYAAINKESNATVETALLGVGADLVVMHGRRWANLAGEQVSSWAPINVGGGSLSTASGSINSSNYGGVRGVFPNGMRVVVDNNVPVTKGGSSNQDPIYVLASEEAHLWEEANGPTYIRADQVGAGSLSVLFVAWQYMCFSFERYASAVGRVTGLVAP